MSITDDDVLQKNVTLLKSLVEQDLVSSRERPAIKANFLLPEKTALPKQQDDQIVDYDGGHFWESVLVRVGRMIANLIETGFRYSLFLRWHAFCSCLPSVSYSLGGERVSIGATTKHRSMKTHASRFC